MNSKAPHLLNLPREIRNIIYGYLHHVVYLQAVFLPAARLRLDNAPYVDVLCTHSTLRAEYQDADCFRMLSATFTSERFNDLVEFPHNSPDQQRASTKALAKVKHLNLVLRDFFARQNESWLNVYRNSLFRHLHTVQSLRLTIVSTIQGLYANDFDYRMQEPFKKVRKWYELPLQQYLVDLPILRHGNGFRVGATEVYMVNGNPFLDHKIVWIQLYDYGSCLNYKQPCALQECYGPVAECRGVEDDLTDDVLRLHIVDASKVWEWEEHI